MEDLHNYIVGQEAYEPTQPVVDTTAKPKGRPREMELTPDNLGAVLRQSREESGKTYRGLQAETGLTTSVILHAEKNETSPSFSTLHKLLQAYGKKVVIK